MILPKNMFGLVSFGLLSLGGGGGGQGGGGTLQRLFGGNNSITVGAENNRPAGATSKARRPRGAVARASRAIKARGSAMTTAERNMRRRFGD